MRNTLYLIALFTLSNGHLSLILKRNTVGPKTKAHWSKTKTDLSESKILGPILIVSSTEY